MKKDEIREQNTKRIEEKFKCLEESKIDEHIKNNLSSYISEALRISQYYGNLRIKYVGFNFTFIAFFVSILTIFMSLIVNFNLSFWTGIPVIIGFFSYFVYFMYLVLHNYNTISFKHSDIQHYSSIMNKGDYPKITKTHLSNFFNLIKKDKGNNPIKNDLKSLILIYFHQANYNEVGLKMKYCLTSGSIALIISIGVSIGLLLFW